MIWVFLVLAIIAVVKLWDCAILLRNINNILFDEEQRRRKSQ